MRLHFLFLVVFTFLLSASYSQHTNLLHLQNNNATTDSLKKGLQYAQSAKDKVELYKQLCWNYRHLNIDSSLFYGDKGIDLARQINSKKDIADITRFKGIASWNFMHHNVSIDLYKEALRISREIGDREGEGYSFDRLGVTDYYLKHYGAAIGNFEKARAIFQQLNNLEGLGYTNTHMNWVYTALKQFDKAIYFAEEALKARSANHDDFGEANSLSDIGLTYKERGAYDSALFHLHRAVELSRRINDPTIVAEVTQNLADVYFAMGRFDEALRYSKESYDIGKDKGTVFQVAEAAKMIGDLYEKQQNYKDALFYSNVYRTIRDSLNNDEVNRKIARQEIQYEYEKQKQKLLQKKDLFQTLFGALAVSIIVITIIFYITNERIRLTKNNQAGLINSTNDLIWSISYDYKLMSANAAYKERILALTGKEAKEGVRILEDLLEHKERLDWRAYYRRGLSGQSFRVDKEMFNPSRQRVESAEISFNPVYDMGGKRIKGLACYARDITERKEHQKLVEEQNIMLLAKEEHLEKLSKELKKVLDSSLDVICSIDKEGRFVQVSAASLEVWGYTPEELTGQLYFDFIVEEDRERTRQVAAKIIAGEETTNFENAHIRKDGSPVPILWSINWQQDDQVFFGVARDASAMREAQIARAESEQRFTALVQNGADVISVVDENAIYKYTSPTAKRVLGYGNQCLFARSFFDFIHADDLPEVKISFEKVLSGKDAKITGFRFKHCDGSWRWLETHLTNLLDNPAVKGIVTNSRDITERKKRESERELMIEELTKSNNDLKQFSYITSHNLRSPLSNITAILDIINYDELDEDTTQLLQMVKQSAGKLSETINDLSKILLIKNNVGTNLKPVAVHEVFDEVREVFSSSMEELKAELVTDFKVDKVNFNETYLKSIFINLISNAIKYKKPDEPLKICIRTERNEHNNTVMHFSDNGIGIDLDRYKDRIFGLYQRFNQTKEGQGLGLFIIKSQIVALGGRIEVSSEVDRGTTFSITFKELNLS